MEIMTFKDIEQILLIAIKMPTMTIKRVAEGTGLKASGLYKWSSGRSRISPEHADIIISWLNDCRPDILIAAKTIFENRGKENV